MAFRKSSHSESNGHCVEVDVPQFRKSSYSFCNGNCVEVAAGDPVAVRDSKDPDGPVLTFSPQAWAAFADTLKAG
jgi:hypothetical protein